jgi:hypothetical protein
MKKSKTSLYVEKTKAGYAGVVEGSTWRHYKGTIYRVTDVAFDCDTNEMLVVYQIENEYEQDYPISFSRPYSQWHDEVEEGVRRFVQADARTIYMTDEEYFDYYRSKGATDAYYFR